MMDTLTFSGLIQRIKEVCFPSVRKQGDADNIDSQAASSSAAADNADVVKCLCLEALQNLAVLFQQVHMKSSEDIRQMCIECCAEMTVCSKAIKPNSSAKAYGLASGRTGRDVDPKLIKVIHISSDLNSFNQHCHVYALSAVYVAM